MFDKVKIQQLVKDSMTKQVMETTRITDDITQVFNKWFIELVSKGQEINSAVTKSSIAPKEEQGGGGEAGGGGGAPPAEGGGA